MKRVVKGAKTRGALVGAPKSGSEVDTMDLNLDSPRPKSGRGYKNMNSEDNGHECLFHLP